jgi:hypothetical protein
MVRGDFGPTLFAIPRERQRSERGLRFSRVREYQDCNVRLDIKESAQMRKELDDENEILPGSAAACTFIRNVKCGSSPNRPKEHIAVGIPERGP